MTCSTCKGRGISEKYYAGLAWDKNADKIIQKEQCSECRGWLR